MYPDKQVGLLWDSVSKNMGDQAIGLVIQRALAAYRIPHRTVSPMESDLEALSTLIVGGGELIRTPGDPFYEAFRITGPHILNTVGVLNGKDTEYLSDYVLVSSRSQHDYAALQRGDVVPCLTLLYGDYMPAAPLSIEIPKDAIGIHIMPSQAEDLIAFTSLLRRMSSPIVWLPITHYAHDEALMQILAEQVPGSVVLPKLPPDQVYQAIGRLRLLITSSLHGGLFAYSQDIPFLWRKQYAKLEHFLKDRGWEADLIQSVDQLESVLPGWLDSPPNHQERRLMDQALCRAWLERVAQHADDALRTASHADIFHLPAVNLPLYQAKMQVDDLQTELISQKLTLHFTLRQKQAAFDELNAKQETLRHEIDQSLVIAAERALLNRQFEARVQEAEKARQETQSQAAAIAEREAQVRQELIDLQNTRVMRFARNYWYPLKNVIRSQRRSASTLTDSAARLNFSLKAPLPKQIWLGKGNMLPIEGWCYSTSSELYALAVTVNGEAQPVVMHSQARLDVFNSQSPSVDQSGNSLLSGFFAVVTLPTIETAIILHLGLRGELQNGIVLEEPIGIVEALPGYDAKPIDVVWQQDTTPRVAICMATYKPSFDLFARQIASIQAQNHQNWICIISDDASPNAVHSQIQALIAQDRRFIFISHQERLGFYRNFERCLQYVPVDADFVSLSDQDDVWHEDKLSTLLEAFSPNTQLAYADMRIVDQVGHVLSETFWAERKNNYTDLATLLFANTITGAASLFRASLLPLLLPFPEKVIDAYHDHWIGLTSMLTGEIAFVPRPLQDYTQHGHNIIGYKREQPAPGILGIVKVMLKAGRNRMKMQAAARALLGEAADAYPFIIHKIVLAHTLLVRHPNAAFSKRRTLQRILGVQRSVIPLVNESVRALLFRRPSLRMEQYHLRIALGTQLWNQYFRREKQRLLVTQLQRAEAATMSVQNLLPTPAQPASPSALTKFQAVRYGSIDWIEHNISPLTLNISESHPRRVNLLMATIDFRYVFGGYIGMFNFALRLHRAEYKTRIILLEKTNVDLEEWRTQMRHYPGLECLLDDVEVIYRHDRSLPVDVHSNDVFIATSCWSAHVAHQAMEQLQRDSFVFLVQDYEPVFVPMNSVHALFMQAYTFPQFNLFSTELLRDYFRTNQIGIYADSVNYGDDHSLSFENAIQKATVNRSRLQHEHKRLLFYARPEPHASRNMFELGMMSLVELLRDPAFDVSRWSFHGIGSIDLNLRLEIAPQIELQLTPRTPLQAYVDMLPDFDVGLSLMLTPHPSLVPLEMAAAGMWTVTNSFANKTPERLQPISSNLIVAPPTIFGIKTALLQAIHQVDNLDSRISGTDIHWSTSWETTFNDQWMAKLKMFLD